MSERAYFNGTPGDDILIGAGTNDQITGGAGNDIMRGFGDTDLLIGGPGDDVYDGGDGDDYAFFYYAPNGVRVDLAITGPQDTGEGRDTFISIENLGGSDYNDTLAGDDGKNQISGGAGNDVIVGRGGDDFLNGDAGNDEIHGGAGADLIDGGDGADLLFGDDGDDTFLVRSSGDTIDGGAGVDNVVFFTDAGVSIDLAITTRQEYGTLQYVTLKNVEKIQGTNYADRLFGDANDNTFNPGQGNDVIDGRGGFDTVMLSGSASDFLITWTVDGWRVADQRTVSYNEGIDLLKNIELLSFGAGGTRALGDGMTEVVGRLLRLPGQSTVAADLSSRLSAGTLTSAQALAEIIKSAAATTSVASLAYEFFTGKVPTQAGFDYLVSSTGGNANNLNSAYYQSFNLENRYINFAVNLGKNGEGKAAFAAKYDAMGLFDATREAYKIIFGSTPTDEKIHALVDSRVNYFVNYGGDGTDGVGTKAAMVGWLLAEAVKADVGVMAKVNDAWLTDLAGGATVPYAIDILDPAKGYYKTDFVFGG